MSPTPPTSDRASSVDAAALSKAGGSDVEKYKGLAIATWPIALVALTALASLWSVCRSSVDDPTESQWQEAAALVRENRKDQELIVFAPRWIDPIGRQYLGDQMSIEMVSAMDSDRFQGIWQLSIRGASSPQTRGLQAERTQHFGPLQVQHFRQTPVQIRYDFTQRWRDAKVEGSGRPRFGLQEVGFSPKQCVLVVPKPDQSVTLTFASVPLGTRIVGYVGLADVFTRRSIRDPGRLQLEVDGQRVATAQAGVEDGWVRFSAETTPGLHEVRFVLTAVGKGAKDRRICFAAEARQ